jgi:hypothetical protein
MKKTEGKAVEKKGDGIVQGGSLILTGALPPDVTQEEIEKMLADDMQRTVEDVVPRLPQIKILHAGARRFQMPPDDQGEEKVVESFEAIIIDKHRCNAWWEKSYGESGGGTRPDCASLDGKRGVLLGGDIVSCAGCPYNRFGTAVDDKGQKTRAKACKNMLRLHLWMEGHILPRRLTLPPTSLTMTDEFFSALMDRPMPMTAVRVKFSLAEEKSSQGHVYSQIRFAVVQQIDIKLYYQIKEWLRLHLTQIRGQEVLTEEYVPNGEDDPGVGGGPPQGDDSLPEEPPREFMAQDD